MMKFIILMTSVDVANKLGVSKPSVSTELKKLKEKGVVLLQPNGSLSIVTADPKPMSSVAVNTLTDIEAHREVEEKARGEAEEQFRREAEEKARREAEEKARREAEEKARREAEEKARHEAEEKERRATEERAKQEAEKKAKQDAEETQRRAAEAQKIAEKARISAEILDLTNEMNSLKGLFVGMKRKKLQARINELNEQLRRL